MLGKCNNLEEIKALNKDTMMEFLGIEYLAGNAGFVHARMFIKKELTQPFGIMHGGAGVAFAESVGGVGSSFLVGLEHNEIRGLNITSNYMKAAKINTYIYAEAKCLHQGRHTHVWNIDVKDEQGEMILSCRLTNFIIHRD